MMQQSDDYLCNGDKWSKYVKSLNLDPGELDEVNKKIRKYSNYYEYEGERKAKKFKKGVKHFGILRKMLFPEPEQEEKELVNVEKKITPTYNDYLKSLDPLPTVYGKQYKSLEEYFKILRNHKNDADKIVENENENGTKREPTGVEEITENMKDMTIQIPLSDMVSLLKISVNSESKLSNETWDNIDKLNTKYKERPSSEKLDKYREKLKKKPGNIKLILKYYKEIQKE